MAATSTQSGYRIEPYRASDLPAVIAFVEAVQEYEREQVPALKAGADIGPSYAEHILNRVRNRNGLILLAKSDEKPIGLICAWIDEDDDMLLCDDMRRHAYVSDVFVVDDWRREGVGGTLLAAIESYMRQRGCLRMRVCSKAANATALKFYEAAGYRPYEVIFAKPIVPA
jgi:GNAT superfamily N-acetyltransferase